MLSAISSGYSRKCKDAQGGVTDVYLFPYVEYSTSQILTDGNFLISFPETTIYRFHSNTIPNATEPQETDSGGKFYNQSISLDLQYSNDFENIVKLIKKDYRVIFRDRQGNYRIFGLYNGLSSDSITYNTGGSKSEFNGFKIPFNGKEENQSFFINNLIDAGFNTEVHFRITQLGDFRITQSGDFRIIQ